MGTEGWVRLVKTYKYEIGQLGSTSMVKFVNLYDEKNVMHVVNFTSSGALKVAPIGKGPHGELTMTLEHTAFPWLIDMLRNEKPIYLRWTKSDKYEMAIISTSAEPIGEEEA